MSLMPPPPQLGPPETYSYCLWKTAAENEPAAWYDELDAARWSIRCVRKYRDGRLEACSYNSADWRDVMPECAMPALETINRDPQFAAREISRAEFEAVWHQAVCAAPGRFGPSYDHVRRLWSRTSPQNATLAPSIVVAASCRVEWPTWCESAAIPITQAQWLPRRGVGVVRFALRSG